MLSSPKSCRLVKAEMEFNLIVVFDREEQHVLMCRRSKEPYQGRFNFVGGKIEPVEDHQAAAYRELFEETSIPKESVSLAHVMDLTYPMEDSLLEVYCGILQQSVLVSGTENTLRWVPVCTDFTNTSQFAGCGNIYHIMSYIFANRQLLS